MSGLRLTVGANITPDCLCGTVGKGVPFCPGCEGTVTGCLRVSRRRLFKGRIRGRTRWGPFGQLFIYQQEGYSGHRGTYRVFELR